jgi:hypothetical protein
MFKLSTNLSRPLIELLEADQIIVDAVEAGPWLSTQKIHEFRQRWPDLPVFLHFNNLVSKLRWVPGTGKSLSDYLRVTQSSWLSFHYSLLPPGYIWAANHLGIYLPPPDFERSSHLFIAEVEKLNTLHLPLLIENMPSFASLKYRFEIETKNITRILEDTDADFLLDMAHAQVAASVLELDVRHYLDGLPLQKVRQIHVSGVRQKGGALYDAHEELQDEDYRLLRWVLKRCYPEVVTLEYFREKDSLERQLKCLQELI